jgi:hypothetical protein
LIYLYQVYISYKSKVKKDLGSFYFISLLTAYSFLLIAILFIVIYFSTALEDFLLSAGWLLFGGFFSFLIISHIYKVLPYLVIYHKDIHTNLALSNKALYFQFGLNLSGMIISTAGILFDNQQLFQGGVSFIFVSSLFVAIVIINILKTKGE